MKTNFSHLEQYRVQLRGLESQKGWRYGTFVIRRGLLVMRIICGDPDLPESQGWEYVSVSYSDTSGLLFTPSWLVMCLVKDLFWDKDEICVQFHPPESKYVNKHPNVLHIWKKVGYDFPMPPIELV